GGDIGFPDYPQRIVSLGSSFTEIIIALNEGDRLVGVDYSGAALDGLPEGITDLGKTSSLSMETLQSLEPDCVIIWNFRMYQDLIVDMEKKGLKVVALYPRSVNDTLSTMERIGEVLGTEASTEASRLVDELHARVNAVLEKTASIPEEERTRIYLELASMGGQTVGSGTISNELIEMAGGKNIFDDTAGNFPAIEELIKERNPQVIVVEDSSQRDNDYFYKKYGVTDAAKNGRIYRIEAGTLTTSPRIVDALEDLARWLHPELFE
ncbi:MAG TPA: ABC transporter substrate-binding protein, partial [Methanomassiliicoccaceae archaeon]|nr:ABC transporter substrate-binding protein [Methanomassiliicoccaceae archaeon]